MKIHTNLKGKNARVLQKGQIMSSYTYKKSYIKRERKLRTRKRGILGNKGKIPGLSANIKRAFRCGVFPKREMCCNIDRWEPVLTRPGNHPF